MPIWPRPRLLLRLLGWGDAAGVHARAAHARVRMHVEEVEPRILHSADLLPGLPPGALVAPVETRLIESPGPDAQTASVAQQTPARELLFVDATLGGYQTLVDDLLGSAGAGRQIDVIVLDGTRDGVEQVATALESAAGAVSAVHFVTHGTEGAIKLGSTWLRVADLGTHEAGLVAWRGGLEAGADLYFYGCNVADTADGRALIDALHALTGADVAASDDVTGAAGAGGNWVLEYTSGITSATGVLALGPEASWSGVLASLTVSTTNDVVDGDTSSIGALLASRGADGAISLREAIIAANNTAGTDSVVIPDGTYILTRVGADDTALLGDLDILGSVDLLGTSVAGTIIDGNASDRVFHLLSSSTVTASDLTVRNASTTQGGAFQVTSGSSLTLTRVLASGNTANTLGGAVQNSGTLNMTDVRLTANNVFNNQGGGLQNAGTATLSRVTIDANNAKFGGGIVNSGTLTLTNVTLSGNVANGTQMNGKGGAIYNSGTLSATNVTLTGNTTALSGGGIFMNGGSATLKNTIIAGNTAGLTGPDVEGAITSAGNNLVGNTSSSSGWVGSDRVNVASGLNATLAFNGGLVPTHALLAGSVAINGGTATGAPAVDARNFARDGTPDIGAYESASNAPPVFTSAAAASAAENQTIALALTASDADGDGVSFTLVGGADAARFVVDGANRLVFASAPNYESPADANADNVYEVQVRVADGRGGSADQSLTVTVYNVNEAPSGSGATVTTAEDTPYTFTIANFGFGDAADAGAHALAAVRITTLPVTGVLRRNGVDVSVGDFVSAADIAAGLLVYTPPADDNGTAYASFTFQVRDDGGTANGGVDLDPTPRTMTIDVAAVNDAPVNVTPGGQSTATNTALVFSSGNGNALTVSDRDAGGGALEVSLAVTQGVLTLSGSAGLTFSVGTGTGESTMTFSGSAAAINAALNGLRYDPTAAYSGPAQLSITTDDLGNSGSGGAKSASSVVALAVSYTNSAPVLSGAAALGSIAEDAYGNGGTLVSALIAGRVTDADAGAIAGIAVTAVVNTNGAWQYSTDARATWTSFGTPSVTAARLLAADSDTYVRFVPNADWNGTVVNGITFRAWDRTSGAQGATADTASGGFSVGDNFAAVSYANQDGTANWAGNWVDSDGAGAGGGQIQVSGGALVLNAGVVSSNTIYRQANLSAATAVTFSFSYNNSLAGLASVSVSVSGDGGSSWTTLASGYAGGPGTASYDISAQAAANTRIRFGVSGVIGGGNFSVDNVQIAYTQPLSGGTTAFSVALESSAITVNAVNDAPSGTSATVTTREDTPYAFTVANFGFSDPVESHGLLAVKIVTLPGAGALTLNGGAVTAGQFVNEGDIAAGLLEFTPSANAVGAGYATFAFQVQDNGPADGGVDLDPVARTMTVDVTSVNDAPTGASSTVTTDEDVAYVFAASSFGFDDATDGHGLLAVKIASLPAAGALTLNGAAISAGDFVSAADIIAGRLVFTPGANAVGAGHASFTFQVQDNGGSANGGVDLDPTARTLTIDVTAVNDAPAGASATVTASEDAAFTFTAAHFGFTDASDTPANALAAVRISSVPVAGTLSLSGLAVTAGQFVSAADITAGALVYTPSENGNGTAYASFTFQVRDDGGTANDGIDLDPTARTMTIDVTAVNDAPINTVPASQTTAASTPLVFSSANGNAISVSDVDAGTSPVQVALTVTNGTLTLGATSGLTFSVGNGSANTSMTFTGTLANVNAALDGLRYAPTPLYVGTAQVSITTSDLGNTGAGGALTAVDYVAVSVGQQAMVDQSLTAYEAAFGDLSDYELKSGQSWGQTFVYDSPGATYAVDKVALVLSRAVDATAGQTLTVSLRSSWGGAALASATLSSDTLGTSESWVTLTLNAQISLNDNQTYFLRVDSNGSGKVWLGVDNSGSYASGDLISHPGVAQGGKDAAFRIIDNRPTTAPVLSGANAVTGIAEDPASNSGTEVSVLIAGRLTDGDTGALSGIAVTAIDDTNGTWQYSLDGTTWTSFGTPSAASARLLASDDWVRFVPNANWHGTVASGLTFRAWDQTTGSAGGVADTTTVSLAVRDNFGLATYSANNGTASWSSSWLETGDNASPASGQIRVTGGRLRFDGGLSTTSSIERQVNLANATSATLTFDFDNSIGTGTIRLLASSNGGASWTQLAGSFAGGTGSASYNLTGYASADTRVRFQVIGEPGVLGLILQGGMFYADNVQISYVMPLNGGNTAFSAANASSGLTVASANDAPVGVSNTVTTAEDTPFTFTAAHFGFSDPVDAPANAFAGIRVVTLPGAGTLRLNGVAVSAGAIVSAADIAASQLVYTPGADDNGAGYASFTFQVRDDGGTANGGVDYDLIARTLTIDVTAVNDAPVLTGANALTAIAEDAVSNGGTSVAALIASFASDVDAGAQSGIAVTAVDDTNGNWQYSTDSGGVWTSFGTPSAGTARLLAADGITFVRFVPDADWNGTVVNGITFRAWDRTTGANGGTASSVANGGSTAFSAATAIAGITVNPVNDAPVLTGANALTAIPEDAVGNTGTSIAALIAGRVSEVDAGALSGIAVTAVDNTNGTWQYTINSGGTWTGFGSPAAGTARLLADDGNTFVRFVPNANWNGTVASGLTFRAWDRTTGANGGTASTLANPVYLDSFSVAAYSNNDGTASWSGNWVDSEDAAAGSGKIYITGGVLELRSNGAGHSIAREVNLESVSAATVSFSYDNKLAGGASIVFEVSGNGGASYTTLGTFSSISNAGAGTFSASLSGHLSTATDVRFSILVNGTPVRSLDIDNFRIDAVTPGNGGATAFSTATASAGITVNAVNDAPAGASRTITTPEDTGYILTAVDFGFSDAVEGHGLAAVRMTTLPSAGTLRLSSVAVTAGQFVSAADIAAGNLVYTPGANAIGTGYSSFTFQVQDNGGAANGGVDLDPTARTLTINVTAVNDAPSGTSGSVTMLEGATHVFAVADFGYADAVEGHALAAVRISTLPAVGSLTLSGVGVAAGQFLSAADIAAGRLVYAPAADGNGAAYASFTFQVQDAAGTADGGIDLDPVARTMTLAVTAVNDAPAGADATLTLDEDTPLVLTEAHFGYSDAADGHALLAVHIVTAPGAGALRLSGVAVTDGQAISAADIAAGNLIYAPAANAHGAGYAGFTFKVQDAGGRANGGLDLDPTARTITLDVTSINDAPTAFDVSVGTPENVPLVFEIANFGFVDAADSPGNVLAAVRITSTPAVGALTLNGGAVTAGQWVSAADVVAGRLVYTPVAATAGPAYASFGFQVRDDGGTANGGVDTDPAIHTLTIDVGAINHRPIGTDSTLTLLEDGAHVFSAADFGYTDPNDQVENIFLAVKITALPGAGALTLDGAAVAAGQYVSVSDLAAGRFVYTPASNANGVGYSSFSFQVQDDGGTANAGSDLDAIARTMTLSVTPVNDAPTGADRTIQLWEDSTYAFSIADFGYLDARDTPSHAFSGVRIEGLPVRGALILDGVAVVAGQTVSAADIDSGRLVYGGAADGSGAAYASFTFRVEDSGGAANGGVNLDTLARTMTLNVAGVNDAPVLGGGNALLPVLEDALANGGTRVSALIAGHATDADAGTTLGIAVIGVDETNGFFQYSTDGVTWSALGGVSTNAARLLAADNYVRFVANADFNGTVAAGIAFRAWDGSIGTAGTLGDTTRGMTSVRDDFTDAGYNGNTGASSWRGAWIDSDRNPEAGAIQVIGNALVISTFNGVTSVYRGVDLSAATGATLSFDYDNLLGAAGAVEVQLSADGGATYAAVDIFDAARNTGSGRYSVALDGFLAAETRVRFVMAGGGNGGSLRVDGVEIAFDMPLTGGAGPFSATTATVGIEVLPVNDAPSGANRTLVLAEDGVHVLTASDFSVLDARDGHALGGVRFAGLPTAGTLRLGGIEVSAGDTVSAADIAAGRLVYAPAANAHGTGYATLAFQVQDTGGTANGGVDLDPIARTLTFDVMPVNDAPVGAGRTLSMTQDGTLVLARSQFGFSDPTDAQAHALLAVKIAALPGAGTLALNGVAVTAGQLVSAAAIDAGALTFRPASGASGASYATFTFQVQDDGGGADLDPIARTMTVDVTPVRREVVVAIPEAPIAPPPAPIAAAVAPIVPAQPAPSTSVATVSSTSSQSSAGASVTQPAAAAADRNAEGATESAGSARARGAEETPATRIVLDEARQPAGVTASAAGGPVQSAGVRAEGAQIVRDARDVANVVVLDAQLLAPVAGETFAGTSVLVATHAQTSSSAAALAAAESRAMLTQLDEVRDSLRDQSRLESATVAATAATGMSLSVGYVVWLLRGGALLSTFLSSLPAWRLIDPLPVLGRIDDDDEGDDADDSLESIVASGDSAPDDEQPGGPASPGETTFAAQAAVGASNVTVFAPAGTGTPAEAVEDRTS